MFFLCLIRIIVKILAASPPRRRGQKGAVHFCESHRSGPGHFWERELFGGKALVGCTSLWYLGSVWRQRQSWLFFGSGSGGSGGGGGGGGGNLAHTGFVTKKWWRCRLVVVEAP